MDIEDKQKATSFRTSEELWMQFKMVCTAESVNVSDKINELVSSYVKRNIHKAEIITRNAESFVA
ncbi:hypothetical protein CMI47_16560 [Candidatus Pacearchaeota archaeon]|jgi:hypothetical protein|nr:hypothetical protein [Candidatus Pacearchaeota archaeon]|tara:strand:- start:5067 stop:5261 length:195 start_codon:yes stop_codon:yes gene_type:complete